MIESIDQTSLIQHPEAFHPDFIKVDPRPWQELMHLFSSYAHQKVFKDENDIILGRWDEMYIEQTLFLWVDISRLDLSSLGKKKKIILERWSIDGESNAIDLLDYILDILKRLYSKSKQTNANWVTKEITAVIRDSICDNVKLLFENLDVVNESIEKDKLNLWVEWLQRIKSFSEIDSSPNLHEFKKKITFQNTFKDGINCLHILQKKLRSKDFEKKLRNGKHPAHIGLLFGFLKSYESIQNQFNRLSKRHIDYYYKTILKQDLLPARPDYVYLFLTLAPSIEQAEIVKDMPFIAGQNENGQNLIFETTQSFKLSASRITELKTLLFNINDAIYPLNKAKMITGIYMDSVTPIEINDTLKNTKGVALYGEPQSYKEQKELPDIGWAIASSIFDLGAGERKVELEFDLISIDNLDIDFLNELHDSYTNEKVISKEELLYLFFSDAFSLQITTNDGWFEIENYFSSFSILENSASRRLKIQFVLSPNKPSWVGYNQSIHGTEFNSELPLLSISLKQNNVYFPYSFLNQLTIETLEINATIINFKEVVVYNKHGLVDSTNPFPILGMNPLKGNSFYIGSKEWQYKNMTRLDINIDWLDLPKKNFEDYYKSYNHQPITDECFQLSLNDHNTEIQLSSLFSLGVEDELMPNTLFEAIEINKPIDKKKAVKDEEFNLKSSPLAFVKFSLKGPNVGFGSEVYLEEMALYGQKLIKTRKKKEIPLPPSKPYIPIAKSIGVDYCSSQHIAFKRGSNDVPSEAFDFYHIHPYGVIKSGDDNGITNNNLIPNYTANGNLYIGIEDAIPFSEVSIFFKLAPSDELLSTGFKLSMHYLSDTTWRKLPNENIVENSTNNGQETGIIRISLPSDLKNEHPLFDKHKDWLRFSASSSDLKAMGRCVYLNTNVVLAKRKLDAKNVFFSTLQPLLISGPLHKNSEILSVLQPFHSLNGYQKEKDTAFYSRISNRLGHKNRMVRARDYKRMILAKFPEVNWIKVLTPSNYKKCKPGEVILMVMPKINKIHDTSNYYIPKRIIAEIKTYVLNHCAPGIRVKVIPPEYEIVEVKCYLKPKTSGANSFIKDISNIINRQIAPWLFHNKSTYKHVNSKFSVGNLIHSINQSELVEEVFDCQVIVISNQQIYEEKTATFHKEYRYFDSVTDGEIIRPSRPNAVLIPSNDFYIHQSSENISNEHPLSISTMEIGRNLIFKDS